LSSSNSLYQRPRWPQAYKRLSACRQLQWATPPPRSINPRHCNHRGSHGCPPHGQEPAHTQDTQDSQQLDSSCCEVGALDVHLVSWLPRSPAGASKPQKQARLCPLKQSPLLSRFSRHKLKAPPNALISPDCGCDRSSMDLPLGHCPSRVQCCHRCCRSGGYSAPRGEPTVCQELNHFISCWQSPSGRLAQMLLLHRRAACGAAPGTAWPKKPKASPGGKNASTRAGLYSSPISQPQLHTSPAAALISCVGRSPPERSRPSASGRPGLK
jgi:hypothetical protein